MDNMIEGSASSFPVIFPTFLPVLFRLVFSLAFYEFSLSRHFVYHKSWDEKEFNFTLHGARSWPCEPLSLRPSIQVILKI